jgi:hypothetical protein
MDAGRLALGLLGVVGMALLATGLWDRMTGSAEDKEATPERYANARAIAALVFLMVGMVGTYFFLARQSGPVSPIGSVVSMAAFAIASLARRRWPKSERPRVARTTRWLDPSPLLRMAGAATGWLLRGARSVADLVEGEAALLWIYVLVVALGVAATVGG